MDPLSVTASIIAVIQLTASLTKYINSVRSAPKEQRTIAIEAGNLYVLLTTLRFRVEDVTSNDPWFDQVKRLDAPNGPLQQFQAVLEILIAKVKRQNRSGNIKNALTWAFDKSDITEALDHIERLKSLIGLALSNDQFTLTLAVKHEVESVTRGVEEVKSHQNKEVQAKILEWLTAIDYAPQHHDLVSRRQEGTGRWLLDSDEFGQWMAGKHKTLFCPGNPGSGKTMIASIVIDHLHEQFHQDPGVGIAYIYCDFRRQHEQTPVQLLASLVRQLFQKQGRTHNAVVKLHREHERSTNYPSLDGMTKVLQEIMECFSQIYVIVDALDECGLADGRRKIFLSKTFNLQSRIGFRLFATSRMIPDILREFRGCISREIRASDSDIQAYIDQHLIKLPPFVLRNTELQNNIRKTILEAADGIFLLAQLHLDSLVGRKSPKAIKLALQKLPTGTEAYDHAYEEAMERIQGQSAGYRDMAMEVLSWIVCAERPLKTTELCHALAVEIDTPELDDDNLPDVDDIVSACAGIVTVDEESDIVRLVHYTTQQYFERTWTSWFPDAHSQIARACLTYLSFARYQMDYPIDKTQPVVVIEPKSLYNYAAKTWGLHVRKGLMNDDDDIVMRFLKQKALVHTAVRPLGPLWFTRRHASGAHLAAHFGLENAMVALIKDNEDLNQSDGTAGRTPLFWAARSGQKNIIELLLQQDGVYPDLMDSEGNSVLIPAAQFGHLDAVKILLTLDCIDLNAMSTQGNTAISLAAWNGHVEVVKLLIEGSTRIKGQSENDGNTLSGAMIRDNEEIVRVLLDAGANVNAHSGRYGNALAIAVYGMKAKYVRLLVEYGAAIESIDFCYVAPLMHFIFSNETARTENVDFFKQLFAKEEKYKDVLHELLCLFAEDDAQDLIKEVLALSGVSWTTFGLYGWTPSRSAMVFHKAGLRGQELSSTAQKPADLPVPKRWCSTSYREVFEFFDDDLGAFIRDDANLSWLANRIELRADTFMPADCDQFYFEVTIISVGPTSIVGVGCCNMKTIHRAMVGWRPGSWGYHGDDGKKFSHGGIGDSYGPTFGEGDVIGCGVDFTTNSIYFTRNGVFLGEAFNDLRGRLLPVVSVGERGVKFKANFGGSPFVYQQVHPPPYQEATKAMTDPKSSDS